MIVIKIIALTLFIIPFLFVSGIITSSVEGLIPLSSADNHIWMAKVAVCGKKLEKVSRNIVYMEMDIIQKIIADISETGLVKDNSNFSKLKLLIRKDV